MGSFMGALRRNKEICNRYVDGKSMEEMFT